MYVDMAALDEECTRLACLMADRSMEHLTVPDARSPEQQGADLEAEFSSELERSFARIVTAGSDPECILPSMLMAMAGRLAILATDVSLLSDQDTDAATVIRSIGGR
ncbi:hypothetical protein GCM10018772_70780 [Streptomyces fumanus]|uniref:Uncharacterized protein n=1 Tax=Streptomyces fumanus TaxID=67302 RepID=A0A919AZU6_9ACTN|nr:hypothetical protein [Streptomyces fumanus]GHF35078.1 hypothetical protein GCM10018772_70780 [Streptomyces fumanus]